MSTATDSKTDRINFRLKHSAKETLERAASFEGKTISNFILTSALEHAERTIHEHETMRLNARDSATFFNALARPVKFNRKLSAAFEEHDRRVADE